METRNVEKKGVFNAQKLNEQWHILTALPVCLFACMPTNFTVPVTFSVQDIMFIFWCVHFLAQMLSDSTFTSTIATFDLDLRPCNPG